jgi:hypothetical protein
MKYIILVLFFLSSQAFADYRVVHMPFSTEYRNLKENKDGSYLDVTKTNIVNSYIDQGCKVIQIIGTPGAHTIYFDCP